MKWHQLEHVIRAAGAIADVDEFVVVGSAALLGSIREPSSPLALRSMEADLYPASAPELADLIEGSIGEGSPFHDTFGYHAHGVGPETAVLPVDWRDRALVHGTPGMNGRRAIFPELHDLALSKLVAARDKDLAFVRALCDAGLVKAFTLHERLEKLPVDADARARLRDVIGSMDCR